MLASPQRSIDEKVGTMPTPSSSRFRDAFEVAAGNPDDPDPIRLEQVATTLVVPSITPVDGSFRPRAPRTFQVLGPLAPAPTISPSRDVDGAWEIGAAVGWGLPVGKIETFAVGDVRHERRPDRIVSEAFIPDSSPIVTRPESAARHPRRRVEQLAGRRYHLADEDNHTWIFGSDNRMAIDPVGYPWHCICHLTFSTRRAPTSPWKYSGEGTGFLVGRNVCVTASHVFPTAGFSEFKVDVVAGSFLGTSTLGIAGRTNVHSVLRVSPYDVGSDLMMMGLYDPVGDAAGWLGTRTYTDRWEDWNVWALVGYPYDKKPNPTWQRQIAIYDDDDGPDVDMPNGDWWDSLQLESYADVASGMSGAPMFGWFEDGVYAVGVLKGWEGVDYGFGEDNNAVASGGRILPAMVNYARSLWD
jgi:hypothetical protein